MAKTIPQRVKELMKTLPYLHKSEGGVKGFESRLRLALEETAKDARVERRKPEPPPLPEPPYHSEAFLAALMNYELSRKQARKSMTNAGREAMYRKIAGWNNEVMATQALEESTANGWQGVFPPRNGNGRSSLSRAEIGLAGVSELLEEARNGR